MEFGGDTEKVTQDLQALTTLSLRSAISDIDFLMENRGSGDDFSLLPDLLVRISNLLASLTEGDKKFDDYSHTLLKVAATQGHDIAKHIVENYKQPEVVDAMEISSPEMNPPPAQNGKSEEIERTRKARLKFFEKPSSFTADSATVITKSTQKEQHVLIQKNS